MVSFLKVINLTLRKQWTYEMERIFIGAMRDSAADLVQSSVRLLNNMKHFKTMQDSRCKPYEESANVVIRQIEQDEAAATDSRAGDGTEANVSGHETNDVSLERPVIDVSQSSVFAIFTMLFCCQYYS